MQKIEMLQILSDKVSCCSKCQDLLDSRIQPVFGEGNPYAKILLIGEGPGKTESELKRPFVGKAGILLDNIIIASGFQRENLYICNIVKCRPPNNRPPTPEEAKNCEPFLKLQIKIVNPKYIVCLGTTATQNLLKTEGKISDLRGRWFNYLDGIVNAKVLCTYHPSYLLRNPSAKQLVWDDLQLLIKEINHESNNVN